MKSARFQLRSIIAITFILTVASACSQANGSPAAPSETVVVESGESSTPSAVPDLQNAAGGSIETPQQQSTSVAGVSGTHFDCATQAGENATIAVTTETSLGGDLVLEPGDEIAVVNPDGDVCAGMAVWAGENIAITTWGDDSQTEEVDGLIIGDPLHFRIWDASLQIEYQVSDVNYEMGDGLFVEDGIYIVGAFTIEN
jgi:hypothetical protein